MSYIEYSLRYVYQLVCTPIIRQFKQLFCTHHYQYLGLYNGHQCSMCTKCHHVKAISVDTKLGDDK